MVLRLGIIQTRSGLTEGGIIKNPTGASPYPAFNLVNQVGCLSEYNQTRAGGEHGIISESWRSLEGWLMNVVHCG